LSGDPVGDAARRLSAAGIDNARLDARLLWKFAKDVQAAALVARDEARTVALFESFVRRRLDREPVAYIVGRKEFWSLDFAVGPGALIPRPDSETLLEALCKAFPDKSAPLSFLDLGTGTGCLLIAALKEYPNARGVGVDQSDDALVWALRNISLHKLEARATLIQSGWLEEATPGFDAVLCNPPYIPTAEIASLSADVRLYEPHPALDGGIDGLAAYRALAPRIAHLLKLHGRAFLEIGVGQDTSVPAILAAAGVQVLGIAPDLGGIPRCVVAGRKEAGR
jgi:release factor glutamine methyltransferase